MRSNSIVTPSQLENFVRCYIQTFEKLTAKIKREDRALILPQHLARPHRVNGVISKIHGVAVEFAERSPRWVIKTSYDERRIEEAVLLKISEEDSTFFTNSGISNTLENVNLVTKEFYEKQRQTIENLTRSVNFVMDNVGYFIKIKNGDIKLIDISLAYVEGGREFTRRINCLWLFGTNSSEFFSTNRAAKLAREDFEKVISTLAGKVPIKLLIATLQTYQELLNKNVREENIQKFLMNNWILLDPNAKRVFSKGDLRRFKMPEVDFLIETSNNKYIFVELEKPTDELFTSEEPPRTARKLREAEAQIRKCISEICNHIDFYKQYFPFMSVENVKGLIIIGRSSKLNKKYKKEFERIRFHAKDYEIITFDELFERIKTLLENLGIRYGAFG